MKQGVATEILEAVFQRRLLADDYLINQTERAKSQWLNRQEAMEQLITDYSQDFSSPTEQVLIEKIESGISRSAETFTQLTKNFDGMNGASDHHLIEKQKVIFASQLTVAAQETISAAGELAQFNGSRAKTYLRNTIVLFAIVSSVFLGLLLFSFLLIWSSASRLQRREAEDYAILSSIGDGVFAIDLNGKIILFNKSAEKLTGFVAKDALGNHFSDIFQFTSESNNSIVDQFIKSALGGKQASMAAHTQLRKKDGGFLPVADSAAPITDSNGNTVGAVVVFRDITSERELEHMKDEFLSIASHELRTPMGAIRANLAMILSGDYGPVNQDLVEPLTDMKGSTVRLVDLVNSLLDVARIEAGRVKFSLQEFDIQDTLKHTVSGLAPLAKEKGIDLKLIDGSKIMVQADADKINQVATNLVGNALKFTDKGSITLAAQNQNDGDMVEVTVTDTGMGISAANVQTLFEKFTQVNSAQHGKPAGTGLGLYISREIVRKMGGELWIKSSRIGSGSVFAFTIPRSNTAAAKESKQAIEHEADTHPDQK